MVDNVTEGIIEPVTFTLVQGAAIPLGLVSNITALLYIQTMLKVNKYINRVLSLDAAFKIGLTFMTFSGYGIIQVAEVRNLFTCSFYALSILAAMLSSFIFLPASAIIRFHISSKIERKQALQKHFLSIVIKSAVAIELSVIGLFCITVMVFRASFGPVVDVCYNKDHSDNILLVGPVFAATIAVTGIITGIIFDIAMLWFLRKRQAVVQPAVAMISWDLVEPRPLADNGLDDENEKAMIPIRATCLNVVYLIFIILILSILVLGFGQDDFTEYLVLSSCSFGCAIHTPLVLRLTVKSNAEDQEGDQQAVVPPQELQFYDESIIATRLSISTSSRRSSRRSIQSTHMSEVF